MGMDIDAVLTFGVKLPEDYYRDDKGISIMEELENRLYRSPYPYPNVEIVTMGTCDDPVHFLSLFVEAVEWGSVVSNIEFFDGSNLDQLEAVCIDLDIDFDPQWYLGSYVSY